MCQEQGRQTNHLGVQKLNWKTYKYNNENDIRVTDADTSLTQVGMSHLAYITRGKPKGGHINREMFV